MATRSTARRSESVAAAVLLGLTGLVFVTASWRHITGPFGDSDEGINGAVWAYNARSLREMGVVDSRLGGRRLDGTAYATHPPLLVVTTAGLETVAGEREAVSRASAWLASLAAIPLLYALGRRAGLRPLAAAAGTVTACATPMFFVYGLMLDTPVTSLPYGLAVALLWYADWTTGDGGGAARPPRVLAAVLSLLAGLAGWQAAFLTGLCALSLAARAVRQGPAQLRRAVPYAVGGAAGVVLSLAWTSWAHDGFDVLRDKLGRRTGAAGVGLVDVVSFQLPWMAQLLGLTIVGIVACAVALRDRKVRPIAALALTAAFGYAAIFKEAAAGHQYWLYWELFPAAIGMAWLTERVLRDLGAGSAPPRAAIALTAGLCLAIGGYNLLKGNSAEPLITDGYAAVDAVRSMPDTGRPLTYVGEEYRADPYVTYYTGRSARFLTSADDLAALAGEHPEEPVLLLGVCNDANPSHAFCTTATGRARAGDERVAPRVVTAAELQAELTAHR